MDPDYLESGENSDALEDATQYGGLVGGLFYLAVITRPDIFVVRLNMIGRPQTEPCAI